MPESRIDKALEAIYKMEHYLKEGAKDRATEMVAYVEGLISGYESLRSEAHRLYGMYDATATGATAIVRHAEKTIGNYKQQLTKQRREPGHAFATGVIIILSLIGFSSFLFVSTETTARVASPSAANLPLGITFLTILVIAIIAMPKLTR